METSSILDRLDHPGALSKKLASASVSNSEKQPFPHQLILAGCAVVIFFVSSLSLWFTLAPLEGAVVSPGVVNVASHRKTVQHFEGGIVETILVRDGDRVVRGDLLLKLSDVQPAAELAQLEGQRFEAMAVIARLLAERQNLPRIEFPEELTSRADDATARGMMSGQEQILESQRSLLKDRLSVLEQKIAQAKEEIKGLEGQVKASERRRGLILEELAQVEVLYQKELTTRTRLLEQRQDIATVDGELSKYQAEIARIQQSILEMRLQISETRAQRIASIAEQLRTERATLFDLSQRIVEARDILGRTRIRSPIDGVVVDLRIHTTGGVITAGQPILDVVPTGDDLIIEAFIDPVDIDEVRPGMPADIRLTSLSRRQRVPIEGIVSHVSADRLNDPQTGRDYYLARIELSSNATEEQMAEMMAGMGADVFIRTGARTPLEYLLAPITRNLEYGLREE